WLGPREGRRVPCQRRARAASSGNGTRGRRRPSGGTPIAPAPRTDRDRLPALVPDPGRVKSRGHASGGTHEGGGSMTGRWIIAALALTSLALCGAPAEAGLADLIPNLFGADGIILAPPAGGAPSHEAHFRVDTRGELTTLNDALKGQLSNFPLSSP